MASQAHKHNATGRDHKPSKAERQAALNKNTKAEPKAEETKPEQTPAPTNEATQNVVAINTGKGAAMRTRWSACLKARPGASLVMAADIKVLPKDSVITSLVTGNPKKRGSADRYVKYGFNMQKGATTTIAKYIEAVTKMNRESSTEGVAIADIAWDINHGFIQVDVPVAAPVDETNTEEVVAAAHEEAVAEGTELEAADQPVPEPTAEIEGEKPEGESEAA